ncbi:MAG: hypothetical protein MZW92_71825 [Comamonadaceae bacterium]|nr:hypothetical protein [Comamonadaceae bacterium]
MIGLDGDIYLSQKDIIRYQLASADTKNPLDTRDEAFDGSRSEGGFVDISYSHDARNWQWGLSNARWNRGFRADLGFVTQVGVETYNAHLVHKMFFKPGAFCTESVHGVYAGMVKDNDGDKISHSVIFFSETMMAGQSYVGISAGPEMERYQGVNHSLPYYSLYGQTKPFRWLSSFWQLRMGDGVDYTHNRKDSKGRYSFDITIKPTDRIEWTFELDRRGWIGRMPSCIVPIFSKAKPYIIFPPACSSGRSRSTRPFTGIPHLMTVWWNR